MQTFPSGVNRSQRGQAGSFSCTDATPRHMPHACWSVFLNNLVSTGQRRRPLENTHTRREGWPRWGKERTPCTRAGTHQPGPPSPTPTPPRDHWNQQADWLLCSPGLSSHPEVRTRRWLEVVLGGGCGRGASLQPPDVAGLTEQTVLQRVAAVAIFIVELQATVLGEEKMSRGSRREGLPDGRKGHRP